MNNIQMIDINLLYPHPDNPRKDVGDVTELADSIKHSGVMQNLTVVPYEGAFRVVIGHRRLAAAKLAGLTELPCVVSDMDPIEQLHTMMSENMQRKDLTPVEEAFGVQMLLDLGESAEDVQKKTGMSRTTFYHRKAMAALPADELQKSYERGGTLADYIALEGIKDKNTREKLLKVIGTDNFKYDLQRAKDHETYKEKINEALVLLEPVAKRLKTDRKTSEWHSVFMRPDNWKIDLLRYLKEMEADAETEYFFYIGTNSWERDMIRIYRNTPESEKADAKEAKRMKEEKERKARNAALSQLDKTIFELRREFVLSYRETDEGLKLIAPVYMLCEVVCYGWKKSSFMESFFGSTGEHTKLTETFDQLCETTPGTMMMALLVENAKNRNTGWYGNYTIDANCALVRDLLRKLGYRESDEERAYWTGTHELFKKEEENA